MRKRKSNSTRIVVGITMLINFLTIQCAWAENWSISMPTAGSVRTKTANVAGAGMTDAADGTIATFSFLRDDPNSPIGLSIEQQVQVTATTMAWSGTCSPNPTWHVSPTDSMGMYVGDHHVNLSWGSPTVETGSSDHVVTD